MILTAKSLLDEGPVSSVDEISQKMGGNLCRCTGYKKIVEAIMKTVKKMG
jgi:carbon-monoxide dehydrogenase small subunit